jgi:hypothetical protein
MILLDIDRVGTGLDLQGPEPGRKDYAWQKRGNGAVKYLAVFPALP